MPRFLVDVNMPYYFKLWSNPQFLMQQDINPKAKDEEIWKYAKQNDLIIISKDSDFSTKMMLQEPPPKVIHVRLGNQKMKEFHIMITKVWDDVESLLENHKLITIFSDRIEAIQ